MTRIDINADIGESYGAFQVGQDDKLMEVITSANAACGFHAGDYNVMAATVQLAKDQQVAIGAHPGLPDLHGFGRREIAVNPQEVYNIVLYQLGALHGFLKGNDLKMQHVKPHGALYHMASRSMDIAQAVARAVKDFDSSLILFGLSKSQLLVAGKEVGLTVAVEAFADRTYTEHGLLTPRSEPNAVLTSIEDMERQVLEIVNNKQVTTTKGNTIPLQADTICFHGDGLAAYEHAKYIRNMLAQHGVEICKVGG